MNKSSYDHDSHVFFITAQGYAGDHWFSWLAKALNSHPELLVYLANEGSRPKYFAERSRSERPDIIQFTKFMSDVGRTYEGIGDCYSYRAYQMVSVEAEYGDRVHWVNIIRHPYAWLYFYVRWRATNMRMGTGETKPLDHEWDIIQHDIYKGLRPYKKEDVHIWAFYRGLTFLNNHMMRDFRAANNHIKLEELVYYPQRLQKIVSYLTHNRVHFDSKLLSKVYTSAFTPFRGEEQVKAMPTTIKQAWNPWQHEAFEALVSSETVDKYKKMGYEL